MRDARKPQAQAARRQGVTVLVLVVAAGTSTIPNGRFHRLLIGDPVLRTEYRCPELSCVWSCNVESASCGARPGLSRICSLVSQTPGLLSGLAYRAMAGSLSLGQVSLHTSC